MGTNGQPGALLRVWRDYFPNAKIIGADIDREVLFSEKRIHTAYIDQTSPEAITRFFDSLEPEHPGYFDIMIDDGLHTFDAAICLFENSFPRLKQQGIYVIEDMPLADIPCFKNYFKNCKYNEDICVSYMLMSPKFNSQDNNLIIIRRNNIV